MTMTTMMAMMMMMMLMMMMVENVNHQQIDIYLRMRVRMADATMKLTNIFNKMLTTHVII